MYQNLEPSPNSRIKMAKGIFLGKSRSQRAQEAISNPVLKFSDALPRNDLRDLNKSQNGDRLIHQTPDFQRPRKSDARQQSKKAPNPITGFDFRINMPPPEVAPSASHTTLGVDEQMIGIALGSPRMVGAQHMMSQMQETLLNTPTEPPKPAPAPAPAPMQRKPSKWKKIGGFFKAKHAMTSTTHQPFYQVRSSGEWPLQGSSHSVDYQPRTEPEVPDTKPSNTEVWPCLVTEPEPNPKNPEQQAAATPQRAPQTKSEPTTQAGQNGLGPMLNIDIPDVQMERYSVMFGGLLGKSQHPAPLNRRSKTLDDITNAHEEISTVADLPPPRRRATSPRPKTPSFTLFPTTQMTKASKVLGTQNIPRGPSPFHRSQSSLVDATHRDTLHNDQDHILLMVHSPSVKSPSSHRTENSVTSFLSTSSVGAEEDEAELLQKIKPVKSYVDPKEEPQWEIINKNQPSWTSEAKQKLAQSLTVNTQELPSESASVSSASSSPILSPLNSVTEKLISPAGSKPAVSPADSTRMPLSDVDDEDDDDEEDEKENRDDTDPATRDSIIALPKVEVSIARSVSVSKGRKQMLVPIGPRADRLSPDERLVTRGGRTPRVMDAQYRHRHGNSQELRIETV